LKIVVTGADGFTGRHFVKIAEMAGHEVLSVKADLLDKENLKASLEQIQFEAVINFAGVSFVNHEDETDFYAVNVLGAVNLLDALSSLPHDKLHSVLLVSSAQIYGNNAISKIDETVTPSPNNHYAMSKLAMEYMCRTYLDRLPLMLVRPFNYTGPGQDLNFVIPKIVDHFGHRAKKIELGNVDVEREYNDIRFVCNAYLALLSHGKMGETYNLTTGRPYKLRYVVDLLTEMTGHIIEVENNPSLMRKNEIQRLSGDPKKLGDALVLAAVNDEEFKLSDTLQWMIAESHS